MRACALCKETARVFCESDQASLCWSCDAKVHGANFLVARHSRTLLCHACQSLTPWKASGPKLGSHTVSFCDSCFRRRDSEEGGGDNEDHEDGDDDDDDDEEEERSEGEGDESGGGGDEMEEGEYGTEEGDNQVVPWSSSLSSTTPPPPASCSSSEEEDLSGSGSFCCGAEAEVNEMGISSPMLKRTAKDSAGHPSQIRRPSSRKVGKTRSPGTSVQSGRPLKYRTWRRSPNPNLSAEFVTVNAGSKGYQGRLRGIRGLSIHQPLPFT